MSAPRAPYAMLAELTHRCPMQCPYCSNPVELLRPKDELDTATWVRVIREAAALGVLQIHFSGGEPTLRPDLEELVEAAAEAGLYTNLITAGVTLDAERLHRLADKGLDHVQLSIQGSRAMEAERIGGYRGAHARKLATAEAVKAAGLALTVNAVMHRQNLDQLPEIIDLAVALKAERLEVAHTQYHGWAFINRAALMPSYAQLEEATETVVAAQARLKGILTIDYVVPDYYAQRPKACMGGWGRQSLNITPDGRVLPCHAAETIPGLEFDRVSAKPLAGIWDSSPAFERFRGTAWMPEPCRSCDQREIDWGGCRCQALALTGDPAATDPACALSPFHQEMVRIAETESASPVTEFSYRKFGGGGAGRL